MNALYTFFGAETLIDMLATIGDLSWLIVLVGAAWYFGQRKLAEYRRGQRRVSGGRYIVGLQVNVPGMAPAIEREMGAEADIIIDASEVLGRNSVQMGSESKDMEKIWKAVWKQLAPNADKEIHLFLSGPAAMLFRFGQLLPDHKVDIEVYHFDVGSKGYVSVANPDKSWLR